MEISARLINKIGVITVRGTDLRTKTFYFVTDLTTKMYLDEQSEGWGKCGADPLGTGSGYTQSR